MREKVPEYLTHPPKSYENDYVLAPPSVGAAGLAISVGLGRAVSDGFFTRRCFAPPNHPQRSTGSQTTSDQHKTRNADRLSELAPRWPDKWAGKDSEKGERLWMARRANLFNKAVALLLKRKASREELWLAAHEISEQLAEKLEGVSSLPRGYDLRMNRDGVLSLALNGVLFGPSFAEPLPDAAAIDQLTRDLSSGWLEELAREGDAR